MFTRLIRMMVTMPGPMVARKQARTGCPLIQAKMMSVAFGGIKSPSREAFAMRAEE